MAYNTNTERLLNAIKNNTANITIDASGGITVDNTDLINAINAQDADITATATATTQTELDTNYLVRHADGSQERGTNLASIVAATQALQTASETLQDVINAIQGLQTGAETLQTVADAITNDTDLGRLATLETNSNTSLGKNGFTYHTGTLIADTSGRAAVQFVVESIVGDIKIGSTDSGVAGTLPAGTIIYGDITNVTMNAGEGGFILYNE